MISIRSNCFETNSSSTHTIAIPSEMPDVSIPQSLYFNLGEFGWEFEEVDPLAYLYTACAMFDKHGYLDRLKDFLEAHNIESTFAEPAYDTYGDNEWLNNAYIDHGDELEEFLTAIFGDEDLLMRYILGGRVITGNDNCTEEQAEWMDNYLDDGKDYTFFYKGN